jgi:hypothetical protein
MKTKASIVLASLVAFSSSAQDFVNLNFENAIVPSRHPQPGEFVFLQWNTAAPGWSHSDGGDTSIIYYGSEHLGLSQYYILVDQYSPFYAPGGQLAGRYSLAFASGIQQGSVPGSPWVNAYLAQTGLIPEGMNSLTLLATGPFQVYVDGVPISMTPTAENHGFIGDISQYAGTVAEIKIVNTALTVHTPTVLDNVSFSPVPVPEPTAIAIVALGVALLGGTRRIPRNR